MALFSAITSALAFTGSQVAAQKLTGNESKDEIERHNKATEALNKVQQEYAQKRAENLDKINAHLAAEGASKLSLGDYVAPTCLYTKIVRAKREQPDEDLLSFPKTPEFSDYYKMSDEERMREYGYVAAAAVVGGTLGWYCSAREKHKKT